MRIKNWDKIDGKLFFDHWLWINRESDESVSVYPYCPMPNLCYKVWTEYAEVEEHRFDTHQEALDYAREYMRKNT